MLMGEANPSPDENALASLPRLYKDDLEFARVAFDELAVTTSDFILPEFHPDRPEFTLLAPEDLRRRCEFIPQEAIPTIGTSGFPLTASGVMKAIEDARKRKGEWPQEQLFWEFHPVMEWLVDKLLVRFGRHEAPVIHYTALKIWATNCAIPGCAFQPSQPTGDQRMVRRSTVWAVTNGRHYHWTKCFSSPVLQLDWQTQAKSMGKSRHIKDPDRSSSVCSRAYGTAASGSRPGAGQAPA